MTTVQDLPEEILREIFRHLDDDDPPYCQTTCRSWYLPAHLQVLEKVLLDSPDNVREFIRSIDCNPNPTYLKAVKSISFDQWEDDDSKYQINKKHLPKLFSRFPNLELIDLCSATNVLNLFDDKFCSKLMKSCPQLTKVRVTALTAIGTLPYYKRLSKVRPLLSTMEIEGIGAVPGFNSLAEYIVSFPQLEEIFSFGIPLDNFEAYLPVIMQLPHLTDFFITQASADQQDFAERYLATLTTERQYQLLKRLSSISNLSWSRKLSFCVNAVKFISKYMTGLKKIDISSFLDKPFRDAQQKIFYDATLEFIRSVNECHLSMATYAPVLSNYFPVAIQKVFHETVPIRRLTRTLRISMADVDFYPDIVNLHIHTNQTTSRREISASFRKNYSLAEVTGYLFREDARFEDVDKFALSIGAWQNPYDEFKASLKIYCDILERLPNLKQLKLDIPKTFIDTKPKQLVKLPQLEVLTLQATPDTKFQTLLENFSQAFPNLKTLDLFYFCGIWNESADEFRLKLDRYSLEKLTVDVTPFKLKMDDGPKDYDGIFVVQVNLLSKNIRRFYVIHWGLSDITSIDESDLQNISFEEEAYITVHITVSNLQCLKLCMYDETPEDEYHDYIDDAREMTYVTLFKE